jgi:hypothetical protein
MRRAEAVRARVAASDDDHTLVFCGDEIRIRNAVPFAPLVLKLEILHREVNAL